MTESPMTAQQYEQALRDEWGTYVAVAPIDIDGARAFNVGDSVPVTHVRDKIVDEGKVSTLRAKAGRDAAATQQPTTAEKG